MIIPTDAEIRKEVRDVEAKYRQCPQSLRQFVAFTYKYVFGSAKKFYTVPWVRIRTDRYQSDTKVSENFMNKVIKEGRGELKYRHLEQIADLYGVPVSVILMFTRCYSDQRDIRAGAKSAGDAEKLYKFIEALPQLSRKADKFSSFLAWVDVYHGGTAWRRELEARLSDVDQFQYSLGECHELCVSGLAHAGFRYGHALKRSSNMIANWLRAANHSRTFLPPFSKLRIAR